MFSRTFDCVDPKCPCAQHKGVARHLVYGDEYVERPVVHRAAYPTDQARTAVREMNTRRIAAELAARGHGFPVKLTDRGPR